MNTADMKNLLSEHPDRRSLLFARGFYLTDDQVREQDYPFYGLWNRQTVSGYTVMTAQGQKCSIASEHGWTLILIGHAYDPFSMLADEGEILRRLLQSADESEFWNRFNQLTGVFTLAAVHQDELFFVGDPTCMQCVFYGEKNGHIYLSSHTCLLGDLLSLAWDPYVEELRNYRFFHLLGNALPGDLTQYREVKRLVPNYYGRYDGRELVMKRFYWPVRLEKTPEEIAEESAEILHRNMQLIADKWNKPAISLTGGCDSKTTLACAEGLYDKFSYFSYISSEAEQVDAEAAHKICARLGLQHRIYTIAEEDEAFSGIEETRHLLEWNTGDILPINRNDVRKRKFFENTQDFDVEVKSWASEAGRAYYSKRFYNRKHFGAQPTPRKCTTLYKFFAHNRKLVKRTDAVFKDYLEHFFQPAARNPIEWQEQFFWEYRVPSWNGLVITGEHRYSFDITIPYNNRRLLELLVSAPLEDRIGDTIYSRIRASRNPVIDSTGIAVTNLKHTEWRAKMELLYYILHSKLPV